MLLSLTPINESHWLRQNSTITHQIPPSQTQDTTKQKCCIWIVNLNPIRTVMFQLANDVTTHFDLFSLGITICWPMGKLTFQCQLYLVCQSYKISFRLKTIFLTSWRVENRAVLMLPIANVIAGWIRGFYQSFTSPFSSHVCFLSSLVTFLWMMVHVYKTP